MSSRRDLASLSADALAQHDVVILDRVSPPSGFAHHGVLAIAPPQGIDGIRLERALARPRITASLASHGALNGVRLDSVRVERARAIVAEPTDQVLVRAGADSLAVARERNGRRELVLGFDLASTDLVERVAFPLFVHHSLRWLSGQRSQAVLAHAPGTILEVPDGVALLGPEGEPVSSEAGLVFDTERSGIYHVGEPAVAVSAAPMSLPLPAPSALSPEATFSRVPPLAILLGIAFLFFLSLEWLLLHRGRLG